MGRTDMAVDSMAADNAPVTDPDREVLLLVTTLPDRDSAVELARRLLEAKAVACVNRLAPCESDYWWDGKIEQAREWPLLIKTTRACYSRVENLIGQLHPYDVPELIAVPVVAGLPPYLDWVRDAVDA